MTFRAGTVDAPPPGFYENVPFGEYLKWDAINWSLLKWMAHSPEKFLYESRHPGGNQTKAKGEGHVFHTCLLEPDQIKSRYAIKPRTYPEVVKLEGKRGSVSILGDGLSWTYGIGKGDARTTTAIEVQWDDSVGAYSFVKPDHADDLWIKQKPWNLNATYCIQWGQRQEPSGVEVISSDTLTTAQAMADRLRDMPDFAKIVDGALFEVSIVWVDPQTGLLCKARLDVWQPHTGQPADGKKTAVSADWEKFAGTMLRFAYAGQAAMYRDGCNVLLDMMGKARPAPGKFRFLVVEDFPPYCPAIYTLADDPQFGSWAWFQHGRTRWHGYLQSVAHAIKNDYWPGHNPGPDGPEEMELEVPDRLMKRLEGMEMIA